MDDKSICETSLSSSVDSSSTCNVIPPTKSRRGRKRVTDPILATELKYHRRSRANDRERTRMRLLNEALEHLRTLLPIDSPYYPSTDSSYHGSTVEDKLTKIETLRTASAYIRVLTDILEDDKNNSPKSNFYSYNMTNQHHHHHQQQQQQQQQAQQPQVYQHSSFFPYVPTYSYYHPYC